MPLHQLQHPQPPPARAVGAGPPNGDHWRGVVTVRVFVESVALAAVPWIALLPLAWHGGPQ